MLELPTSRAMLATARPSCVNWWHLQLILNVHTCMHTQSRLVWMKSTFVVDRVLVKNVEKMKEAMPMTDMEKYSSELEKVSVWFIASAAAAAATAMDFQIWRPCSLIQLLGLGQGQKITFHNWSPVNMWAFAWRHSVNAVKSGPALLLLRHHRQPTSSWMLHSFVVSE